MKTPQKKLVYQLSDGSRGSVEIGKASGIASTETITRYWKSWAKLGLGENLAVQGGKRFKRAFDLEDFGIEVPEPKENIKEEKQVSEASNLEKGDVSKQSMEES